LPPAFRLKQLRKHGKRCCFAARRRCFTGLLQMREEILKYRLRNIAFSMEQGYNTKKISEFWGIFL
jgi:hypothetical protein